MFGTKCFQATVPTEIAGTVLPMGIISNERQKKYYRTIIGRRQENKWTFSKAKKTDYQQKHQDWIYKVESLQLQLKLSFTI